MYACASIETILYHTFFHLQLHSATEDVVNLSYYSPFHNTDYVFNLSYNDIDFITKVFVCKLGALAWETHNFELVPRLSNNNTFSMQQGH